MKKYFKYLFVILFVCFIVPQIAFASWWNPFSWNIWSNVFSVFNKPKDTSVVSQVVSKTDPTITEVVFKKTETEQKKTEDNTKPINQTPSQTLAPINPVSKIKCNPNWQCGNWSNCLNSQQTRVCVDSSSCGDTNKKPATTQSCVVVCTPNWQCTDWSVCSNSQQLRVCTDSNNCGITTGIPSQTQSCISACTSNWQCSGFGTCTNNQQTQTCTDLNNCGVTTNKPAITQACVCTPNWQCTAWSNCTSSPQTRTCSDINNCNTYTGEPALTQSCVVYTGGLVVSKFTGYPDQTNYTSGPIGKFVVSNQSTSESIKITAITVTVNLNTYSNNVLGLSMNEIILPGVSKVVNISLGNNDIGKVLQSTLTVTAFGLISNISNTSTATGQTITFN